MESKHPFEPIKRQKLYEDVASQIKRAIFEGHIQAGDHLPPERELCKLFNVGRPTIREALRSLHSMGLIEVNGSKGSTVREYDFFQFMEMVKQQISWLIKYDRNHLRDLWEVRKYIELGISHSAARNAEKEDFSELDKLIKQMESCIDDIESYFSLAVKFHDQLAKASRNKIFYLFWGIIRDILLRGYFSYLSEIYPDGPKEILEANKQLLSAIKSGTASEIDRAMQNHATAERYFLKEEGN